jgi:hypothetical protein
MSSRISFAMLFAVLFMIWPAVAAAGVGDNIDSRSRSFVKQLRACELVTGLAVKIVQASPNDLIGASKVINQAKDTCSAIRNRMVGMDTRHFSDQALDGEVAVDYWTRGLGRFSNYIDDGRPSDVTTAAKYFATARGERAVAIKGINSRRAVYGLGPIK